MQAVEDDVRKLGVNTFPIPLGLKRDEKNPVASKCVRCYTCDGYPCLVHAKATSVLDAHCKAHDLDNLFVVDAACFPSASAVNPSLTIIANAIRVSDHLLAEHLR